MNYLVGYIYDGDINKIEYKGTLEEAEKWVFGRIGDEQYTTESTEIVNVLDVKHYYIDYNQFFIIKLK